LAKIRRYESEGITVAYDASRCIHAAECVKGLPRVFNPRERPWVRPEAAEAERVRDVVLRCPTGALFIPSEEQGAEGVSGGEPSEGGGGASTIEVSDTGPLFFRGRFVVVDHEGNELIRDSRIALCRCGASRNKPFCDGTHAEIGFPDESA
jgi:uncharacterized Fe-S cluster protein YjdI